MKLADIIALTKAGFKAAEIRQMMADQPEDDPEPEPDPVPEDPAGTDDEPEDRAGVPEDPEGDQEESPNSEDPEGDQEEPPNPEPDYKKLYEETQRKLKKAQLKNAAAPGPEQVSDSDKILKLVNEFL